MTSKKCQSKVNNNLEAIKAEMPEKLQTPPLPQAPLPPSELMDTSPTSQPPILSLQPLRPDSASSTASAGAATPQPSLTITPLVSPKVSLPTEPEPPSSLFGGANSIPDASNPNQLLAAMAAGAMALTNPLLLNPLLMMQSLQNIGGCDLNDSADLIKNLKSLMQPSTAFPMMSLWPSQQPQFRKPTIAETFNGSFNESEVLNLRHLLESVNASVTKSLLEDNLKKWASTCGLSSEDILQQLAQARPLSPGQLMKTSEEDVGINTDDEMTPASKKEANSSSQRPRALISDDQVATLKAYYAINSKPRREELIKISDEIGKWKFTNFSATQILREINVGKLAVLEIAILTILETLNFDF